MKHLNYLILILTLCLATSVFAADSTQAPRLEVRPKSPIPVGTVITWPLDTAVPPGWLACDGQAVPGTYLDLRALMATVPNYNNKQFLRGSTSGAGQTFEDTTKSHMHTIESHMHTVSGSSEGGGSVSVPDRTITIPGGGGGSNVALAGQQQVHLPSGTKVSNDGWMCITVSMDRNEHEYRHDGNTWSIVNSLPKNEVYTVEHYDRNMSNETSDTITTISEGFETVHTGQSHKGTVLEKTLKRTDPGNPGLGIPAVDYYKITYAIRCKPVGSASAGFDDTIGGNKLIDIPSIVESPAGGGGGSGDITITIPGSTITSSGGDMAGFTDMGGNNTNYTGETETAPKHTLVKYIIKAE